MFGALLGLGAAALPSTASADEGLLAGGSRACVLGVESVPDTLRQVGEGSGPKACEVAESSALAALSSQLGPHVEQTLARMGRPSVANFKRAFGVDSLEAVRCPTSGGDGCRVIVSLPTRAAASIGDRESSNRAAIERFMRTHRLDDAPALLVCNPSLGPDADGAVHLVPEGALLRWRAEVNGALRQRLSRPERLQLDVDCDSYDATPAQTVIRVELTAQTPADDAGSPVTVGHLTLSAGRRSAPLFLPVSRVEGPGVDLAVWAKPADRAAVLGLARALAAAGHRGRLQMIAEVERAREHPVVVLPSGGGSEAAIVAALAGALGRGGLLVELGGRMLLEAGILRGEVSPAEAGAALSCSRLARRFGPQCVDAARIRPQGRRWVIALGPHADSLTQVLIHERDDEGRGLVLSRHCGDARCAWIGSRLDGDPLAIAMLQQLARRAHSDRKDD